MAAEVVSVEQTEYPCPRCERPILREHRRQKAAGGVVVKTWDTWACSSGASHHLIGWESSEEAS